MEFCKKCGNMFAVRKKRTRNILICNGCGKEKALKKQKITISDALPAKKKGIVIMKKGDEAIEMPKTHVMCPKCEHREAYWWMQQTRSADEPPTVFYRCAKCKYSWRSYG